MNARLITFAALLLVGASAFAADKDVEALLAKMRQAYKSTKSAKFTTRALVPGPFGEAEIETVVSFVSPNKIHALVKGVPEAGGSDVTFRTDGKTMVAEGMSQGKVEGPFDVQIMVQALAANLETLNFWDWERQLSTKEGGNMQTSTFKIVKKERWNEKDWIVLEESAPAQNVFVRYYIDPKTYFMWRTVVSPIDDKKDIQMDARIAKFELNPKLDAALFKIG